ncbi:hypothetical protein AB0I84_00960 [Streptomyces spectabilis]|uniref:hypothetical protein n=1 Tax=Streptomyces spectabilis TaxID=68270 RepID=UPI0033FD5507
MNNTIDFVGEIHTWLAKYNEMAARHHHVLAPYMTPDGDVDERQYGRYDETRFDNSLEADDFLDNLVGHLEALAGPPVPGQTFTLTFAGPERHDGEKPYSFVVNGSDLDDARRALITLPSWREWYEEQRPWDGEADEAADVLFVADESHPGIPEYGYFNDLRREQAVERHSAIATALTAGIPEIAGGVG